MYTTFIGTLVGIFAKYVRVFRSYHALKEMSSTTANMSIDERNDIYQKNKAANKKCKKAMKKQMAAPTNAQVVQSQYLPPCMAPTIDGALSQHLIVEDRPNQLHDNECPAPVQEERPQ